MAYQISLEQNGNPYIKWATREDTYDMIENYRAK